MCLTVFKAVLPARVVQKWYSNREAGSAFLEADVYVPTVTRYYGFLNGQSQAETGLPARFGPPIEGLEDSGDAPTPTWNVVENCLSYW